MGATDGASNVVTNNYQFGITGPSSCSLTFDANSNMTSDGTTVYAWHAENRLIKITYPGSGNFSQILYDASGIKGQITETVASALTSTKQFVNSGSRICEERNASSTVIKKFFSRGQTISVSNYFYFFDHLGSVRDMTDSSGLVQAHYEYDLYGQRTKTAGALDSDFQYAGYYMHAPSGLNLTVYRAYNSGLGRWISRDPIEEDGGPSLHGYSSNGPVTSSDPLGLYDYGFAEGATPQYMSGIDRIINGLSDQGGPIDQMMGRAFGGPHPVVFKPNKCGANPNTSRDPVGGGIVVETNPGTSGDIPQPGGGSVEPPPAELMVHELTHVQSLQAYHFNESVPQGLSSAGNTLYEQYAINNENTYREQHGLPGRRRSHNDSQRCRCRGN